MSRTRREFPKAVKVAVIKRATRDNDVVYCEKCGLPAKKFQIDHIRPDGLLGEPVIENAELICEPCFQIKNPADATAIAHSKRREAKDLRVPEKKRHPIAAHPSAKSQRVSKPPLAPRSLFVDQING